MVLGEVSPVQISSCGGSFTPRQANVSLKLTVDTQRYRSAGFSLNVEVTRIGRRSQRGLSYNPTKETPQALNPEHLIACESRLVKPPTEQIGHPAHQNQCFERLIGRLKTTDGSKRLVELARVNSRSQKGPSFAMGTFPSDIEAEKLDKFRVNPVSPK